MTVSLLRVIGLCEACGTFSHVGEVWLGPEVKVVQVRPRRSGSRAGHPASLRGRGPLGTSLRACERASSKRGWARQGESMCACKRPSVCNLREGGWGQGEGLSATPRPGQRQQKGRRCPANTQVARQCARPPETDPGAEEGPSWSGQCSGSLSSGRLGPGFRGHLSFLSRANFLWRQQQKAEMS